MIQQGTAFSLGNDEAADRVGESIEKKVIFLFNNIHKKLNCFTFNPNKNRCYFSNQSIY